MPENEITCISFEIDKGMLTSIQFRCEIERPFTNLNDISTKLAGKTYINGVKDYFKNYDICEYVGAISWKFDII